MAIDKPPHIEAALSQLESLLKAAEKRDVDCLNASWSEIEKSIIKVLGGAFKFSKPEHQLIALGLAAVLGEKLLHMHNGFWFPNSDSVVGVSLGFSEAMIVLSPFEAVSEALGLANLGKLDELTRNLSNSLSSARMASGIPLVGAPKLDAELYQRLFDPGFVQLMALDMEKAQAIWKRLPGQLMQELKDALARAGSGLPAKLKAHMENQFQAVFNAMEPHKPMGEQWERHGQTCELAAQLWASPSSTGPVPEGFWEGVVFPLLFIGFPETFPPLEEEEVEAAKKGVPALYVFLEVVPHAWPSPEDDALLSAFAKSNIHPLSPTPSGNTPLRMLRVDCEFLQKPLSVFSGEKLRATLQRFSAELTEKTGGELAKTSTEEASAEETSQTVLKSAIGLLDDLKEVCGPPSKPNALFIRRLTEAEAEMEGAFEWIRKSLQGPKLILV
ncbi:MAG: hypothetical protein FWC28_04215 [Proteobacteria bacterium]|nr:hypothetical protein [Cystobacterineae bacterium]MCL2258991.1 hypothetical protein [Cystobacterineae bacterium]MCL2314442.1 hypothetical protein [Pseudomonadota bacterium]